MAARRIITAWPASPFYLLLFLVVGLLLAAASMTSLMLSFRLAGLGTWLSYMLASTMVALAVLLSPFNLVVAEYESRVLVPVVRRVEFFGLPIHIPDIVYALRKTTVAINLGGCLIPVIVSAVMLAKLALTGLPLLLASTAAVLLLAMLVYPASRIVRGVGVVVPGLYPPIMASILGVLVAEVLGQPWAAPLIAYVSGSLGTLIGADLLNLGRLVKMGVPLISIGGMGTFDGIYLSGILAIALSLLLIG